MPARHALTVRAIIKPSARRPGVTAESDLLRVAVRSPPVEGRANAEATERIANAFGVPKSRVELVRGARGRIKHFRILDARVVPDGFEPQRQRA